MDINLMFNGLHEMEKRNIFQSRKLGIFEKIPMTLFFIGNGKILRIFQLLIVYKQTQQITYIAEGIPCLGVSADNFTKRKTHYQTHLRQCLITGHLKTLPHQRTDPTILPENCKPQPLSPSALNCLIYINILIFLSINKIK